MRHGNLYRSTPFRLALTFCILFIAAFLVSGAVTYQLLKRELVAALDTAVVEIYTVTASTYAQNDLEDLVATINAYAALKSGERIFSLVDASGKRIAGNVDVPLLPDGLANLSSNDLGLLDDIQFRVKAGSVGANRLVVGQSFTETDDMEDIALISFGWALLLIVMIAIAGGLFLASRAQRRLDGIVRTMVDVSNGQMNARIPLQGNNDDIDTVSLQINNALDRLAGLVEGMRQVSADIAHELKTPLNRLKMIVEESLATTANGRSATDLLTEALAETDRINATFEALLRISQIEAGARKTRFNTVNLSEVVATVGEIYQDVAEDNGQVLSLSTAVAPCFIAGDRELLTQMVVNLVENAITHCPHGAHIQLSLAENGSYAIAVSDDGPGIPAQERELVFRRLYRLDKSRTTPGSGLGLSLVRAIADLHSGKISLKDNRPGLCISVAFPKVGLRDPLMC